MVVNFIAGVATASKATGPVSGDDQEHKPVEASGNTLNISYDPETAATWTAKGLDGKTGSMYPGISAGLAYSEASAAVAANDNHAVLNFGSQFTLSMTGGYATAGGYAYSELGAAEATDNTLDMTDAIIVNGTLVGGYAYGVGTVKGSNNTLTISGVTQSGMTASNELPAIGGYAYANAGTDNTVEAKGNTVIIKNTTVHSAYGGRANINNSYFPPL